MAAAPKVVSSPLYKVIDAVRWDAEGFLGRFIVLVHAAFIDAGFVLLPLLPGRDGPIPREAGRVASTLSLRYTVPQLLHRLEDGDAAAVVRREVYDCGRKMILYVQCEGRPVASSWWVLADAISFLSGDLDATARALRRDTRLAALWCGLSDNLCARALADLCQFYDVAPTFLSLPDDVKTAILTRLTEGADLACVECTCTALSCLVADRGLWKALYDALHYAWRFPIVGGLPEKTSWKVRYARARRWQGLPRLLPGPPISVSVWQLAVQKMFRMPASSSWSWRALDPFSDAVVYCRDDVPLELPADPIPDPRKLRSASARSRRHEQRSQMCCGGKGKRRYGAGAIHAPSSRYRWNHR